MGHAAESSVRFPPLFVTGRECCERLGISESSWPAIRRRWEERGFPRPNAETGKYLWPAVRAWVFQDNGFHGNLAVDPPDGEETWT